MANNPRPPAGFDDLASFGDFSAEDARDESAALKDFALSSGKMLGKFPEGATNVRVLPKRPDSKQTTCFLTVFKHVFNVGRATVSFYCPRMMSGGKQPCPACKEATRLLGQRSQNDQEAGKEMRVAQRFLANSVVRGKEDVLGVKVWEGSGRQQEEMLRFQSEMGVNFSNPVHGQDVVVMRTGQGFQTKYQLYLDPNGKSRLAKTPDAMRALLEQMHDLPSLVSILSPAEIQAKMQGRDAAPGAGRGGGTAWGGPAASQGSGGGRSFGSRAAAPPPPAQNDEDDEDLSALDDEDETGDEGGVY